MNVQWVDLVVGNRKVQFVDGLQFTLFVKGERITECVEKVEFKLHSSFSPPQEVKYLPPFEIERMSWGTFPATIVIHFKQKYKRGPLSIMWHTNQAGEELMRIGYKS